MRFSSSRVSMRSVFLTCDFYRLSRSSASIYQGLSVLENPRKQLGTSETRYAFFNIKNKNTVETISKTHWKRTHLDVLFSWERTRNLSIHCWCICYVQYCTVRSPGSSIWKRSERVNANNKTTAKGVGPAGAEPTKQKSWCKFMRVTQKVTVSQIPRRLLKMQETFSPHSFFQEKFCCWVF